MAAAKACSGNTQTDLAIKTFACPSPKLRYRRSTHRAIFSAVEGFWWFLKVVLGGDGPMLDSSRYGLGWIPDLADPRDFSVDSPQILKSLRKLNRRKVAADESAVDWREYSSPPRHQASIPSSSAHATVGLWEYFERRAHGSARELSALFIYQTGQRLLNWREAQGLPLRVALKALTRFGAPREDAWPHDCEHLQQEPPPALHFNAAQVRSLQYVRIFSACASGAQRVKAVRRLLAAGFAIALGFPVFESMGSGPDIPYPRRRDGLRGGQAVVALGYSDRYRIGSEKGALLIRNSWGSGWGDHGHGWLPYRYLESIFAFDCWTLLKPDWLASGEFAHP